MDQPLGMHPAPGVQQDGALPGAVADDRQVKDEAWSVRLPRKAPAVAMRRWRMRSMPKTSPVFFPARRVGDAA
jgi:hypothetical protein